MDKHSKKLANLYQQILESDQAAGGVQPDPSTKYQSENLAKIKPVEQDTEEKEFETHQDKLLKKLEQNFVKIKSLIDSCRKDCRLEVVSELYSVIDSPEFKTDLENLKLAVQKNNMETGFNAMPSSSL